MCLAVPGRVLSVRAGDRGPTGMVDFGGEPREVSLALVPEVQAGDYVVVHLGTALDRLDARAAGELLAEMERLGDVG